jgi:hypothetical protein
LVREASAEGFTMASLVEAVVMSDPFRMRIKQAGENELSD